MSLNITQLSFTLLPVEKTHLPEHPGSTFRGAFGHGLKDITCHMTNQECKSCNLREKCVYSLFFNPFLTEKEKRETSSRFHNKPRPFVFEPEITGKTEYDIGDAINFKLNIFGKMHQFLPYVIESWRTLQDAGLGSKRSKFILSEIWQTNNIKGHSEKIYDYQTNTIKNKDINIQSEDFTQQEKNFNNNQVELIFKKPVLIKNKGSYLKDNLTFYILMKNVFRRLSSLAAFYGNEMKLNFNEHLKKAKEVSIKEENLTIEKWSRYSNRQNQKINMQGLKGSITYEGDLSRFIKFLIPGQYIHIGKNTVFGQGEYLLINSKK